MHSVIFFGLKRKNSYILHQKKIWKMQFFANIKISLKIQLRLGFESATRQFGRFYEGYREKIWTECPKFFDINKVFGMLVGNFFKKGIAYTGVRTRVLCFGKLCPAIFFSFVRPTSHVYTIGGRKYLHWICWKSGSLSVSLWSGEKTESL